MNFRIKDKKFKKDIEIIENACKKQYGEKQFMIIAQVGLAKDDEGEDHIKLTLATFTKTEAEMVKDISNKRLNKEFDLKLDRDFFIADLEKV